MWRKDDWSNRSGQTYSNRTAEGQTLQGAWGSRTLMLWGSEGGAAAWGTACEALGRPERQAGHTDCSTNSRITGIVTPTQPP